VDPKFAVESISALWLGRSCPSHDVVTLFEWLRLSLTVVLIVCGVLPRAMCGRQFPCESTQLAKPCFYPVSCKGGNCRSTLLLLSS
jgi:hypothetical protein